MKYPNIFVPSWKAGCKVSFNFLYFPHKAEFMSGSQEILMFNDWKCSTGMKFKFLFDILALSFHFKEVWVFKLVLSSLYWSIERFLFKQIWDNFGPILLQTSESKVDIRADGGQKPRDKVWWMAILVVNNTLLFISGNWGWREQKYSHFWFIQSYSTLNNLQLGWTWIQDVGNDIMFMIF